jgi:hypothetical protein
MVETRVRTLPRKRRSVRGSHQQKTSWLSAPECFTLKQTAPGGSINATAALQGQADTPWHTACMKAVNKREAWQWAW